MKKIAEYRKKKSLTQRELASLMGVTERSEQRWESGERTPDIHTLRKLAKIFNCKIDDLIE